MAAKDIVFGNELRSRILEGASTFAKAVTKTMGPKSGTVMLLRMGGLLSTKDGVTVAREIYLKDPVRNMGCAVLREACIKVNDNAGDGTTTTACLANAILQEANKLVAAGFEPMQLSRDLQEAAKKVQQALIDNSMPVEDEEDLMNVALISCNGDRDVAETLTEACLAVGKNGTVIIDEGNSVGIELEFKEGLEMACGSASSHFLDNTHEKKYISPLIAVVPKVLSKSTDVIPMLEESSQWPNNDLIILCYGIEGEALKTMVMNHTKGVVRSCAIPMAGLSLNRMAYLKDLAAICGCEVLEEDMGYDLEKFNPEWFGSCEEILVQEKKTVITSFEEAQDSIKKRTTELEHELQGSTSDYDRDKIQERISKLNGGFCIVRVGGYTEVEMKEKRARIEDALGAVQSALRSGVVAGGGVAYLTASRCLSDTGAERILKRALMMPMVTIIGNASQEGYFTARKVLDEQEYAWDGWDVINERMINMAEKKIFDPLAVALQAVESSVSVSSMLITVEAGII